MKLLNDSTDTSARLKSATRKKKTVGTSFDPGRKTFLIRIHALHAIITRFARGCRDREVLLHCRRYQVYEDQSGFSVEKS
jgi:hypothetical protein